MSPFQPPADYTRREVEAANAPSCPFYGCSLVHGGSGMLPSGGNQCALVTSAYSPCYMSGTEHRAPDWKECPRNPEYVAANIWVPPVDADEEDRKKAAGIRIVAALRHLNRLMNIRTSFDVPAGDVPR